MVSFCSGWRVGREKRRKNPPGHGNVAFFSYRAENFYRLADVAILDSVGLRYDVKSNKFPFFSPCVNPEFRFNGHFFGGASISGDASGFESLARYLL